MTKKILIISDKDWANMGCVFAESLKENKYSVDSFNFRKTKIEYDKSSQLIKKQDFLKLLSSYDILQIMHSGQGIVWNGKYKNEKYIFEIDEEVLSAIVNFRKKNKKLFLFHGGSAYRTRFNKINSLFNGIVDKTLIQTPDLLNLGANKEILTYSPFTEKKNIKIKKKIDRPLIIGHFPSNPAKKNSGLIIRVLNDLKTKYPNSFKINYSKSKVSHTENLKRMSDCDIYIEDQTYIMNNRKYCSFGLTAMEAASVGCIVVTCNAYVKEYNKMFGSFDLVVSNSESELRKQVEKLILMNNEKLLELKQKSKKWSNKHTIKNFGSKLAEIYNL